MKNSHPWRLLIKALIIFVILNLAYAEFSPPVGRLSIYNWLVPGRLRFPAGKNTSYVVTTSDVDSLFASHVISGSRKVPDEYRVLVLGDSQTWGVGLSSNQTLTEQLNGADLVACGKQLRFYNLAYPFPSVVKDFLILNRSLGYKPDLIVWMLSTDSLIPGPDALNYVAGRNPKVIFEILHQYHLDQYTSGIVYKSSLWESTIVGRRIPLYILAFLQLYGPFWAATRIDNNPGKYQPLSVDLKASQNFLNYQPPNLDRSIFAFDVFHVTHKMIGQVPVLVVNEPIYIAPGENSTIRYNSDYPRWAYDQYRQFLQTFALQKGWNYLDFYNLIPYTEFTDSNFHLNPSGEVRLAKSLAPAILHIECP